MLVLISSSLICGCAVVVAVLVGVFVGECIIGAFIGAATTTTTTTTTTTVLFVSSPLESYKRQHEGT